jgi:hypothetical protein
LALLLRLLLRLATGNEGRKAVHILLAVRLHLLRALVVLLIILLIVLLVILLVILLVVLLIVLVVLIVLIVLLLLWLLALLRIKLLLTRGKRLAGLRLVVAVVIAVILAVAAGAGLTRLLLVIGLALAELLLRRGDQTKIMFGMLIVVLGRNRVTGTLRVAGKLQIFLADVGCRAANFHVRSIRLVHARQWILVMMMTTTATTTSTLTVATPHALVVLTVSHGCCSANLLLTAARTPPFTVAK